MRVHVIDAPRRLNSPLDAQVYALTRGFWFPAVLARPRLKELGVTLAFHENFSSRALDCDLVLVSSRHHDQTFGTERDPQARARSVALLAERASALGWVDMRDSSGTTQFEVLPFVQVYLKQCLLKDRSLYALKLYGGRIFTDDVHERHGVIDTLDPKTAHNQEDDFTPLDPALAARLQVGWNIGYSHRRLFLDQREEAAWVSAALTGAIEPLGRRAPRVAQDRPNTIAAMMTTAGYCRETIAYQRRAALRLLQARKDDRAILETLPPYAYAAALERSQVALSCFGNGEICYREHEAWQSGAAVVMPDMSHLETFPQTYLAGDTYHPVAWDLSDLDATLDRLIGDKGLREHTAEQGQRLRRELFGRSGLERFAARLAGILKDAAGLADARADHAFRASLGGDAS